MNLNKKITCIIPARLKSSRFPKKILALLAGKPLIQWVWEATNKTNLFNNVLFAIDSQETANAILQFGGKYIMTSEKCATGTDRLVEVVSSKTIESDIWVNWQCDEPFITKKMIQQLLQSCDSDDADIWTLKKRILNNEELSSPNTPKVVCNAKNFALYFSRCPIPYHRLDGIQKRSYFRGNTYFKHIGIFAYKTSTLKEIASMPECSPEKAEKLEQLRFLYNGLKIKVHETDQNILGIDTPEDLKMAEKFITQHQI